MLKRNDCDEYTRHTEIIWGIAARQCFDKNNGRKIGTNGFSSRILASATPMFFASIVKRWQKTLLFVLNDNDEAGYFYNDLKTIAMPENEKDQTAEVLFFPSSYRRAVKYGQRDAGNEILRTEVLSHLSCY